MNLFENILIIAGISLDVFASMEIQGAMLQNIKKKTLLIVSSIAGGLQLLFFFGGYLGGYLLADHGIINNAARTGYVLDTVILALLGIRLIYKAIRKEFVNEKRTEITVGQYARIIAVTTVYTLAVGLGCGLVGTNVLFMLFWILVCSVLVVISGLYSGYHFGFQNRTVVYAIGAIVLWVAGIEILITNVLAA